MLYLHNFYNCTEVKGKIARENLALAKRIFNIMEGESEIAKVIDDTKHLDAHPGTMNFYSRVIEAQRIHNDNMLLAARLQTVQPTFKKADLCFSGKRKQKKKTKNKVSLHPYTHTHIHTYTHTPIHPYTHTPIHPYTHTLIHPYTHTLMFVIV